jgi:exosortase A
MFADGNIAIAAPSSRPWVLPLAGVTVLSLLWALLYRDAVISAVGTWIASPTYSHCFLILPVVAYLIWDKRHELSCLEPEACVPALLLAVPAGLGWIAGALSSINEIQQLSAVAMYQVILLATLGPKVYRVLLFPALLLFFLVPTGQYLVPPLQRLTTWFVSSGLSALNILHYTEGNVIELANGRFLVAEACAGLRFLIANIVLCAIFAHFAFRKPLKIGLFLLAALLVPIAANCLRALSIVLIAHWTDNRLAVGADHLVYGWGFSVVILLGLFAVAAHFRDPVADGRPLVVWRDFTIPSRGRMVMAVALAALALSLPAVLVEAQAAAFPVRQIVFDPRPPPGWTKGPAAGKWQPKLEGTERQVQLQFRGVAPVDVLLGTYRDEVSSRTASMPENQLWDEREYNLVRSGDIQAGGKVFRELVLAGPAERRLVWWTYWKDGRFTSSNLQTRLLAVRNAFGNRTGVALLVLSTPVRAGDAQARATLRSALWIVNGISSVEGS